MTGPTLGGVLSYDKYRISVETLENGYAVECPDMEAIQKAQAAAAKNKRGDGSIPSVYLGDYTKKYAAKTVKDVLKIVKASLEKMPESEYDAAFDEAAASKD